VEVKGKWTAVFHIFQLAQILYLPQDGRGEGLLGEELLDWVNDVDPRQFPSISVRAFLTSLQNPTTP
jgi:nuclear pore complex protein Nup85